MLQVIERADRVAAELVESLCPVSAVEEERRLASDPEEIERRALYELTILEQAHRGAGTLESMRVALQRGEKRAQANFGDYGTALYIQSELALTRSALRLRATNAKGDSVPVGALGVDPATGERFVVSVEQEAYVLSRSREALLLRFGLPRGVAYRVPRAE